MNNEIHTLFRFINWICVFFSLKCNIYIDWLIYTIYPLISLLCLPLEIQLTSEYIKIRCTRKGNCKLVTFITQRENNINCRVRNKIGSFYYVIKANIKMYIVINR